MNIDDMRRKITPRTSAVQVVHVLGGSPDMDAIVAECKKHQLMLLEDTCESLGSFYKGKALGAIGGFGTYSFYFSHHITTGEGGMVVCQTKEDWDLLKCIRAHGWSREDSDREAIEAKYSHIDPRFLFINVGYNLRPMEISGIVGIRQLARLPECNKHRKANRDRLIAALQASPKFDGQFDFMESVPGCDAAWFGFGALLAPEYEHQLRHFLDYLTQKGIQNRPVISGNFNEQPALDLYDIKSASPLPGADHVGQRGFFVGVHTFELSEELVQYFAETVLSFPFEPVITVLVTGGSGLAGRGLQQVVHEGQSDDQQIQTLLKKAKFVFLSSKDGDLRDQATVTDIFRAHKPAYVLHLACHLMAGFSMGDHAVDLWEDNMSINRNVVQACHAFRVRKLVSCLSSFAFPEMPPAFPIKEEHLHAGLLHPTYETYGGAKRSLDVMTRAYRRQFGSKFVTVNPTNLFGPGPQPRSNGPLVEGIASRILKAQEDKAAVSVWGSGKPLRQMLYTKDLAKVLLWAIFHYDEDTTVNVVGEEVTVSSIVEVLSKAVGFDGQVDYDSSKADGPMSRTVDGSKLARLFPAFNRTSLPQAIKECVQSWKMA